MDSMEAHMLRSLMFSKVTQSNCCKHDASLCYAHSPYALLPRPSSTDCADQEGSP